MHELGIARGLFFEIMKEAQQKNIEKIRKVVFRVGVASGIEKDFLFHSFADHVFPGTPVEGAELEFLDEAVKVVCGECGKEIQSDGKLTLSCPYCQSIDLKIVSGKDVTLDSVE